MAKYNAKKNVLKEIKEGREIKINADSGYSIKKKGKELTTQDDLPVEKYIWNVWQVVTGRSQEEVIDENTLSAIKEAVSDMQKEVDLQIQEIEEEYVNDDEIYKTVKISEEEIDEDNLATVYKPKEKTREELQRMVRAASYLIPEKSNMYLDDSMRLIRYFKDYDLRIFVEKIMEYPHSEPILYKDRSKSNKMRKYILEKFDAHWNDLSLENKIAVISLVSLNKEQFDNLYQILEVNAEDPENLFPIDLVNTMGNRNRKNANSKKKRKNSRTAKKVGDSYTAGRAEEDTLFSPQMEVDIVASEMIYEGYENKDIIAFHKRAPRGYWDHVIELSKDSEYNGDVEEIYEELEDEYNFHPLDEMKPPK